MTEIKCEPYVMHIHVSDSESDEYSSLVCGKKEPGLQRLSGPS